VRKQGLKSGWGFSALIETEHASPILFDTGGDGSVLLHNMRELGIDARHRVTPALGARLGYGWPGQAVQGWMKLVKELNEAVAAGSNKPAD